MGKDTIYTRRQIEGMIADGKAIVIVDQMVLRLDSWLNFHPGGDKAIRHMVGRDATDEVNCLHSAETRARMHKFQIGKIQGEWLNFQPPLHDGKFRPYVEGCEDNDDDLISSGDDSEPVALDGTRSTRSSSASSEDHGFLHDPSVRRRKLGTNPSYATSSVTSVSDIGDTSCELDTESARQLAADLEKYPSPDRETQKYIIERYRQLEKVLRAEGLFECRYRCYMIELARYLTLLSSSLISLHFGWYKVSAFFLGAFWQQITFSAHDAGHLAITHNFQLDTAIGIFIANFCGGLSLGWWKLSHNVHHIVTNEPEHDPDIQHLPFFAVSHRFFEGIYSTYYKRPMPYDLVSRYLIPVQNWLYHPILCFGRFNLYRLSWEYLIRGLGPNRGVTWWHRWFECAGMVVFWGWFGWGVVWRGILGGGGGWWDVFWFVMISHVVTMPLHVQITLSHFAMSTADLGVEESFPQKMLRTTMDVDCPWWLDFFHGGLQFQAVHHLFPRLPRHNLRRAQNHVIEFCRDVRVPYSIYGFYDGNKEVLSHLKEIGRLATVLAECQSAIMIEEGKKFGGHF
ncbi:fatty acid desaturase-domain-containing protein [Peziza echinospora]|nr:fatty acid desaturase-domain-containing protein [Peziza echinospora]